MKKLLLSAVLLLPLSAFGEHMDVIEFELRDGCSFSKYMGIVSDFNKWGEAYGYHSKIAMPLQNENLTSLYWLGTSANATAFGKAWDAWRDAQGDADSAEAKLNVRFEACSKNLSRHGYDIY